MTTRVLVCILLLFSASCAIITDENTRMQSILVETPYADGAYCNLMDSHGNRWIINSTPKLIAIKAGYPPLTIFCQKRGYKDTALEVEEYVKRIYSSREAAKILEETVAMVRDPYGVFVSRYPNHVKVWMEPKKWPSEKFMKQWSYEREVYNNEMLLETKAREEKYQEYLERQKEKKKLVGSAEEEEKELPDFLEKGL